MKHRQHSQPPINLCNSFIVSYLERKKHQLQRTGMDRKAFVYLHAIATIKKYPLPIISALQLRSLHGVGETLTEEILKIIKDHYKNHLKKEGNVTRPQMDHNDEENEESVNQCRSNSFNNIVHSQKSVQNQDDTTSNLSFKSAVTNRTYKPKPKTQGAYILAVINDYSPDSQMTKEMLVGRLKEDYGCKITPKNLALTLGNLSKWGYVETDSVDFGIVRLTEKGRKEVENIDRKTKDKDSELKVKSVLNSFLSAHQQKQKSIQSTNIQFSKQSKKYVAFDQDSQLYLLVDAREMKDKQEQSFFQKKITEKYGIKVKITNLPIGDFMWQYAGQILDYVVERKKADDLMSSIIDGRYKQQKYRLKNSSISNIYYLYEGHLTGSYAKQERSVSTALLSTRVKDKFKVVEVNTITQSLKFLNFLTQSIRNKLAFEQSITCLGTLQEVAASNGKAGQLTVEHIFGLGIKTIPGVGKQSVAEVLKHFSTFRELYEQLYKLASKWERVQFMRGLLKGSNVRGNMGQTLVSVLFGE